MENPKKKIIILTSFAIAIILIILLISTNKKDNSENNEINNVNEIRNVIQENIIENSEITNEIENTVNEVIPEENDEEEIIKDEQIADPEQEVDKETMEKIESDEEKAINIAKKHYGESASVYFSFEGIQNGKYKVSVRDSATTRTIREYYINIETGKFEILQ